MNGRLNTDTTDVFILELDGEWAEDSLVRLPQPGYPEGRFLVTDWSPNGRYLSGMQGFLDLGGGVVVYDFETGTYDVLTEFGQWPVWLPDNRHLLFVTQGTEFHVVDRVTRETRLVYSAPRDVLGPPTLTDDGREVFFSRRHSEADIWLVRLR